jgi:hypothetical protein
MLKLCLLIAAILDGGRGHRTQLFLVMMAILVGGQCCRTQF